MKGNSNNGGWQWLPGWRCSSRKCHRATISGGWWDFLVNSYTTDNQRSPSVAIDDDGDFVVTWWSYQEIGGVGNGSGIYAQRFNNAGVAQGSEIHVNTYTFSNQLSPDVAMDIDGDFVITWFSDGQDGFVGGIYAQRFNNMGVPQGAEFRVNTYTASHQVTPSIAMNSNGNFVISWESQGFRKVVAVLMEFMPNVLTIWGFPKVQNSGSIHTLPIINFNLKLPLTATVIL